MGLIKVRATGLGFNGGPNAKAKSIWAFSGDRKNVIADEDRGLKNIGDVFMIEESKFTDTWMQEVETEIGVDGKQIVTRVIDRSAKPQVSVTAVTQANPAVVSAPEAVKRGRPKKIG